MDIQHALTPELASRMAVTAVTTDIEYWARTACVDGHVGINDLIRTLDVFREASVPNADSTEAHRDPSAGIERLTSEQIAHSAPR